MHCPILLFTAALLCVNSMNSRLVLSLSAPPPLIQSSFQEEMLGEVNRLRTQGCRCGNRLMPPVPALQWNKALEKSALAHARDMYVNRFFDHDGSNGSDFSDRISRAGYRWSAVAENIGWGYDSVQEAVEGWRDSPLHCRALMSRDYTEIGVARAGAYWVQDFGRRR